MFNIFNQWRIFFYSNLDLNVPQETRNFYIDIYFKSRVACKLVIGGFTVYKGMINLTNVIFM